MYGDARGGNDALTAKGDDNGLYGDARLMNGDASGGNDALTVTGDYNRLMATPGS